MKTSEAIMIHLAVFFLLGALTTASARAEEPFFPDRVLGEDPEIHKLKAEWFGKHLKAAKEPSLFQLSKADPQAASYRFLYLPTFFRPISVRINRTNSAVTIRAVQLNGQGGYEPGKIVFDKTRKLTEKDWDKLRVHVEQVRFWEMTTEEKEEHAAEDAAEWIVEGVSAGKYHIVSRADPEGDYEKLCLFVLSLSGLDMQYPFVPEHVLSNDEQFSQILMTMKEPSLWMSGWYEGHSACRFLWVRPNAPAVAVRVEEFAYEDDDGEPTLHILESNGNEPVTRKSVKLTQEKWQALLRELERSQFRTMPAEEKTPPQANAPHLILEGIGKTHGYHVIDRAGSSPRELKALLEFVSDLAGPDLRKLLDAGTPKP